MKNKAKILLFFSIFILILSCTERDRLNPLDPQNPNTGGKPQGLKVYSEYDTVTLSWNPLNLTDIVGYRIYRKTPPDSEFALIHLVPKDSTRFVDKNLKYEQRYVYQISVLTTDFESNKSDTVSIIPGPTFVWVSDVYNQSLIKLSHDCAHQVSRMTVGGYPWELARETETNRLWYTDILLNRVYTVDDQSLNIVADLNDAEPIDITLDEGNRRVWVVDETKGRLYVFNFQGKLLGQVVGFTKPIRIDCFFKDGTCYVVDAKENRIVKIDNNFNIEIIVESLDNPYDVSVNQTTGEFWVSLRNQLVKYDSLGTLKKTINTDVPYPICLAVDSERGTCWIIDWVYGADRSRLICYSENGQKLVEVSGFNWPENIIINTYDHSCIVADSGAGKVIKVREDGSIYGEISGFDYPRGLNVVY